jgi:hypothetical protein
MEREGGAFRGRVGRTNRKVVGAHPEWLAEDPGGVIRVDGGGAPGDVEARLRRELAARWPETFPSGQG